MLQGVARLAIGAPKRILAVAVLVMIGTAIFGIPVTKSLSAGGNCSSSIRGFCEPVQFWIDANNKPLGAIARCGL